MNAEQEQAPPVLRVVRGDATAEELAALLAVLGAGGSPDPTGDPAVRTAWNDPRRSVRVALPPGDGAWRASAWPR